MRLDVVLLALPRIWRRKAERALVAARIPADARLDELTDRQRGELVEHFRQCHPGIWAHWQVMWHRAEEHSRS